MALLAVPFLIVTVEAQTTTATQSNQPSSKKAFDEKEFRRLIGLPDVIDMLQQGADPSTLNAAALAALGATTNQQRPTIQDMLFSDQFPAKRELHGWRIDQPATHTQQKVHPDRDNLLTIPHWSDTF
ncbi:MAG: hypothetical protein LC674_04435, partial [Actinobacteria bacterium]|nr:hypothetical protein [Actinomycetota bacterium]